MMRLKTYFFLIFLLFSGFNGMLVWCINQLELVETPHQIRPQAMEVNQIFADDRRSSIRLSYHPVNWQIMVGYFLDTIAFLLLMIALYRYLRRWELQMRMQLNQTYRNNKTGSSDSRRKNNPMIIDPFPINKRREKSIEKEADILDLVNQIIETNLSNEQFDTRFLCKTIGMSKASLYRKLKEQCGFSIACYIRMYRLRRAEKLLETTDLPVGEVAFQVGFKDFSHFSRTFQKEIGLKPSKVKAIRY